MHRALFVGTLLGAALLNAGCQESSSSPAASNFTPRPVYENREPEGLTTRLSGFAVDPEAYFFNLANCAVPPAQCPLPPLYAEFSPLFQRSVVRGALVTLQDTVPDPATGQPPAPGAPVPSDAQGLWTMEKVPTRRGAPYFVLSVPGPGTVANDVAGPFPLPPVPAGNYLTTMTVRPVVPAHSACVGLEALQMSDQGILDAVARSLSAESAPATVTVADLLNPAKYGGVTVFWLYAPGFPVFRVPADNTTVEASSGRVLHVEWAPPGALPPALAPLQSARGFFIPPGPPAASSSVGIIVVVQPPLMGPPATITYTVKDTLEIAPGQGPRFVFQPLDVPQVPGLVTFAGLQLNSTVPTTTVSIPPLTTCLPGQ